MATEHTQVSSYGPISAPMQLTQTLPVQTQPPTQLLSHEVPQFTLLIDHDSVDHVHGDTLINSSDLEEPGHTLILHDDTSPVRSKSGSSPPAQRDDVHVDSQATPPPQVGVSHENELLIGVTAEDTGTINTSGLAPPKKYINPNIPDSDATTEEGDIDGFGYLDEEADAESLLHTTGDTEGDVAPDNLAEKRTPSTTLAPHVTNMTSSQSRPVSIQTVPLCAPGLLAVNQSASLDSARKDNAKFDSSATAELTSGVFNSELKNPFQAPDTALGSTEGPSTNKAAGLDSMHSLPKAVLPSTDATKHSPHMFISTPQKALEQDPRDQIDTVESDKNAIEGLSSCGRVPEMPIDYPESVPTPLEPLTAVLKKRRSQESLESRKELDQDGVANDASPGASVTKHPSPQNASDLITDKLADAGNAVLKALETEGENAAGKFVSVIHAPVREQRFSLPSSFHAAPTNLSYLRSQEPGEETQLNAFNMVDKLVWLETACMPDDIVTSPAPQDGSIKDHTGAKGLRSLAQAAQMKTVRDNLDVFDWEDSQVDKVYTPPDAKEVLVIAGSRKRQSEAHKPMTARKKQATSDQKRIETTLQMETKGNDSTSAETLNGAKTQVPNLELSRSNLETKPHTLLTTRLRNRTKAESRPLAEPRKGSSLKRGPIKRAGKGRKIEEYSKDFEAEQQKDNIKVKLQQAGPNAKGESGTAKDKSRKRAGRKKAADESGKDLKIEQLNGSDNIKVEVQKSGPSAKSEARKQAGGKEAVEESGEDLKIENKRNKSLQAASLSAKGKEQLPKTSKVGPEFQGSVELAERTSQDDAAADIWIEAFANTKNKITPTGSDVELIKFRKRNALREDTGQDSKKCRTMEPSTVDAVEKEETPLKENRVEPEKSQRGFKKPENISATKNSWHEGKRVSTRLRSQDENQELAKKDNNLVKEKQSITKSKTPRIDDTQVKARRISTRSSKERHQDAPIIRQDILMKKNKVDPKQCETADAVIMHSIKNHGVSTCSSEQENSNIIEQAGNAKSDSILERGPKTRPKDQRAKSIVAGSDAGEGKRAKIKTSTAQAITNDKDGQSLSSGAMQGDFEAGKPSIKTRRSKKKENLFSHQHSTVKLNQDAEEIEAGPHQQAGPSLIDVNEGAPAEGPKRRSRRRVADDRVSESAKAVGKSVSQPKEKDTDKSMLKMEELVCSRKGDVSKSTILRRTRSNTCDDGSQKSDFVDKKKDGGQSRSESATEEQTPQNQNGIFYANKGLKEEAKISETKTTKSVPRQNKKTSAPERSEELNSSDRGKRRKTEPGCIRVLFSHCLTEDIIKHQKKILAKLGGQLATSASDCTHFVSNGFVRTQNMLISMAAGKIVATPLWLENCGQAHYFVDAKKYILQDKKKEKELGFSMVASLASAERKPLLKGVQVLVCPNTVPEQAVLQAIVENAGGQVMDIKSSSSLLDSKESVIIANEKDFDFCLQFLDKGLKMYSEELLLHGIVTQSLDFSRHRLFEDFKQGQGRRRRAAKISA